MSADLAVRCEGLVQVYGSVGQEQTALRGVDLHIERGQMVALLGPSGAGKSTLLWILAGLMRPTAGLVQVCGADVRKLSPKDLLDLRLRRVGVVLQNPGRNLIPHDTALGNVTFAQRPTGRRGKLQRTRAMSLLDRVGLAAVARRPAGLLSGGEQQRLAVAVALANGPEVLLADEPTSQLDHDAAASVIELIRAANTDLGTTVVAVTHDADVGASLGRTVIIRDGRVGAEGRRGQEYVVVGRDGSVQLPDEFLDVLRPGSLAQALRTPLGVELRPVGPEEAVSVDDVPLGATDHPDRPGPGGPGEDPGGRQVGGDHEPWKPRR